MSTEEKDREFRDRCDVYFEGDGWLTFDRNECDLDRLVSECISYGRATPDREMLQRFAATIHVDDAMLLETEIDEFIDQFLQSEANKIQEKGE